MECFKSSADADTCAKKHQNQLAIRVPFESEKKCWIFSFLIRSDNVTVLVKEASPKPSIIVNKRRHAKRFGYFDEVNKKR